MTDSNERIQRLRQEYADTRLGFLDEVFSQLQSPIEQMLAWALLNTGWYNLEHYSHDVEGWIDGGKEGWPGRPENPQSRSCIVFGEGSAHLIPQLQIGKYRTDLALIRKARRGYARVYLAIECDGHEFHERTREQAQRDKARDREMQRLGWIVARYTGSEIAKDPSGAAKDIWQLAFDLACRDRPAVCGSA